MSRKQRLGALDSGTLKGFANSAILVDLVRLCNRELPFFTDIFFLIWLSSLSQIKDQNIFIRSCICNTVIPIYKSQGFLTAETKTIFPC